MKSLVPDANPTDCWHNLVIFLTLNISTGPGSGYEWTPLTSLLLYPSLPRGCRKHFSKVFHRSPRPAPCPSRRKWCLSCRPRDERDCWRRMRISTVSHPGLCPRLRGNPVSALQWPPCVTPVWPTPGHTAIAMAPQRHTPHTQPGEETEKKTWLTVVGNGNASVAVRSTCADRAQAASF